MKVAYIGTKDQLSEAFIMRMCKEGNDVYFLSTDEFPRNILKRQGCRTYKISMQGNILKKVVKSILPDWVVFAGKYFMDSVYEPQEEEDVALLVQTLQILAELRKTKLILLSSTQVYGKNDEKADEHHELMPASERGMRFVREEQAAALYRKQYGLHVSVVRASLLYSEKVQEEGEDFLSRAFTNVINSGKELSVSNEIIEPLHVLDFVDGLKRVMGSGKECVFNISGSFEISQRRLYELISEKQNGTIQNIKWIEEEKGEHIDNSLIKKQLEWTDFRMLERQLENDEITFVRKKISRIKRQKSKKTTTLQRILENVIVFAAFFAVYYASISHSLFSQIDYLTIYVILMSVFLGIRQSALAVILASGAYLYMQDLSILEMTNFYSYAGSVLKIMEFVFLGLVVSYTADMLREDLRDARRELKMRVDEYEELKKINDENIMIKNEYEERVLDSKSGFPKLYNMISRLMVLQPDRIFMEIIQIISEMVHTDTVAVYLVKENSPYLRLINALNEESTQGGKSWDVYLYPDIRASIDAGELYQGNIWKGEPAIVLPILHQGKCVSAILIKSLPYTSQTLYYINLLKTLSLLLQEAVGRALDYEELVRDELYIEDTDILKPEPFKRNILLAKEKAEKHLAEYCVAQIKCSGDFMKVHRLVSAKLRTTDYLGADEDGNFYVLLNNTSSKEAGYLQKRFEENDITVTLTTAFEDSEEL